MFAWIIPWPSLNMGHVDSKTRLLGQISLKPCVHPGEGGGCGGKAGGGGGTVLLQS